MLAKYLPDFIKDIKEIDAIMKANGDEIYKINENISNILNDMFVKSATEKGATHYEKMLNIYTENILNLEDRKYKILAIYNQALPFTEKNLIIMLNAICEDDGYVYTLYYEKFYLKILLKLCKKQLQNDIKNLLERIVPMNIKIDVFIKYNVWEDLKQYTWRNLCIYNWGEIKEMEIKKNE